MLFINQSSRTFYLIYQPTPSFQQALPPLSHTQLQKIIESILSAKIGNGLAYMILTQQCQNKLLLSKKNIMKDQPSQSSQLLVSFTLIKILLKEDTQLFIRFRNFKKIKMFEKFSSNLFKVLQPCAGRRLKDGQIYTGQYSTHFKNTYRVRQRNVPNNKLYSVYHSYQLEHEHYHISIGTINSFCFSLPIIGLQRCLLTSISQASRLNFRHLPVENL